MSCFRLLSRLSNIIRYHRFFDYLSIYIYVYIDLLLQLCLLKLSYLHGKSCLSAFFVWSLMVMLSGLFGSLCVCGCVSL